MSAVSSAASSIASGFEVGMARGQLFSTRGLRQTAFLGIDLICQYVVTCTVRKVNARIMRCSILRDSWRN